MWIPLNTYHLSLRILFTWVNRGKYYTKEDKRASGGTLNIYKIPVCHQES